MYFLSVNEVKKDADRAQIDTVIPPHIQWLKEQMAAGRVAQAGKWGGRGGMTIIRAADKTEAQKLLSEDPLVKSGLITYELDQFFPMADIS